MKLAHIQSAIRLVYPPRCTFCGGLVDSDFGLCGPCWRDTPFIAGQLCNLCGVSLPAGPDAPDDVLTCDECISVARPWGRGRAALMYKDNGRRMVLMLKHGDRHDVAGPAALWLARAAQPLLKPDTLVVPVPLHWLRLLRRRYNQAVVLARAFVREVNCPMCPDLLIRPRATPSLGGLGREERFAALSGAIKVHPRRGHHIVGRDILLVDDVMTTGATLAVAAEACFAGGAASVNILTLARAAKDA